MIIQQTMTLLSSSETRSLKCIVDKQLHELVKKAFEAIGLTVKFWIPSMKWRSARRHAIIVTNEVSFLEEGDSTDSVDWKE